MKKMSWTLLFGALVIVLGLTTLAPPADAAPRPHKPNPPSAVTITALNTAMNVAWSAPPAYVGPPVTSYKVLGKVRIGRHWIYPACQVNGNTFHCELTGLTNGMSYLIAVTATNSVGTSFAAKVSPIYPTTAANCSFIGPYANLQGCYLPYANLTGDDLTGANLTGTQLPYANFANVNLTGANLSGANLAGITSGGVTGTGYTLPTGWAVIKGYLVGPNNGVTNTDLSGATFGSVDLSGASMYYDNLTGAHLAGANFSGTDLRYDNFANVNLTGVDLSGANLAGITSGGVTGTGYTLPTGWAVVGGYLVGPNNGVTYTDLSGATFGSVDLSGASMYYDNLTGSVLTGGTFTGTNMIGDDFTNADLTGAFTLAGANLSGATWSNTTCPDGTNSGTGPGSTCVSHGI